MLPCFESAIVITMTNMFSEHFYLVRACRMEWVSLCVPIRAERTLQQSEMSFSRAACLSQAGWWRPRRLGLMTFMEAPEA